MSFLKQNENALFEAVSLNKCIHDLAVYDKNRNGLAAYSCKETNPLMFISISGRKHILQMPVSCGLVLIFAPKFKVALPLDISQMLPDLNPGFKCLTDEVILFKDAD